MRDTVAGFSVCGFETILTVTQTNEVFQTIQIILTCLSTALVIAYTIWKWYKNAKKDGKITKSEVDELFDDINKTLEIKEKEEDGNNN